jgi:hypothetical protein
MLRLVLVGSLALAGCSRPASKTDATARETGIAKPPVALFGAPMTPTARTTDVQPASSGLTTNSVPGISSDEVSRIAAAEARRRRGVEVVVRKCVFQDDVWLLLVEDRDSAAVGNFCWLEVDTKGNILGYHAGR